MVMITLNHTKLGYSWRSISVIAQYHFRVNSLYMFTILIRLLATINKYKNNNSKYIKRNLLFFMLRIKNALLMDSTVKYAVL